MRDLLSATCKLQSRIRILSVLLLLFVVACSPAPERVADTSPPVVPLPTLMPTPTGAPPTAEPEPADTGWVAAGAGVELRRLRLTAGELRTTVSVARLDPAYVRFAVGYAPDAPGTIADWAAAAGAIAAINGGFFDEANRTVSLLVRGGQPIGASYVGRGGMFAVGADGAISIRALSDRPYDPAEPLAEALQGWPLLVRPGGAAAYDFEDGARARRSALAIDRAGRVLLIACPGAFFTLAELSAWLAGSDLDLEAAINLDGGSSTAMLVTGDVAPERIDAFVPLPIVLLALPK